MFTIRLIKNSFPYTWLMLLGLLLAVITIFCGIGLMMTAAFLISMAALQPLLGQLQMAIVGVRFFGTFRGVFRYSERLVSHNVTFRLLKKYRIWFYQKVEPLAPANLFPYNTGDLLRRVVADVESLDNIYIRLILPPLAAILISIIMWFFFLFFSIKIAVLVTGALYLSGFIIPSICYLTAKQTGIQITNMHSQLTVTTLDATQGLADLTVFNQVESYLEKLQNINNKLSILQKRMAIINSYNQSALNLIMNITVLISIFLMVPAIHRWAFDAIISAVIVLGIMSAFEAVTPLPSAFQQMGSTIKAAKRVFEIIDSKPTIDESFTAENVTPDQFDISFKDVNFEYSANSGFRLSKLDFHISQGTVSGVVGPSGSGKSSLINLLMRFWDYNSGSILLGNCEFRKFKQENIHKYISLCQQHIHMFNETIKENLVLTNPTASDSEIESALKLSEAYDLTMSLPKKLNTAIGELGLKLSGGELRRLAIARTLLSQSPILIFDEPTADLDIKTAEKIVENLYSLRGKRTIIIISHIITKQFKKFDNIIVMRNGSILEKGNHCDLLKSRNSLYLKIFELQNCKK